MDYTILGFVADIKNDIIKEFLDETSNDLSVYSGKSGVLCFLIEYYVLTKDESILSQIDDLINSDLKIYEENKVSSYAFYTGNSGFAFLLIKLYAITKEEKYKEYGLLILKNSKSHFDFINRPLIELISGVSGILLALLHTANSGIEEEWLYEDITFYIELILESANISKEGIFWDVTQKNIQGLTGFSHGASGIGFVFFQIYKLTNIEAFKEIAYLSFEYEDSAFIEEKKNWRDFRHYPYTEPARKIFIQEAISENASFFTPVKTMNAWCHGAPGILLSRIETQFKEEFTREVFNSVLPSIHEPDNHSICHSRIGNALCFMHVAEFLGIDIKDDIQKICSELIDFYKKEGIFLDGYNNGKKNHNLFMGTLGTLYFLLKAQAYINGIAIGSSIVFPKLENTGNNNHALERLKKYDATNAVKIILSNKYKKTFELLDRRNISLNYSIPNFKNVFAQQIAGVKDEQLSAIYNFEHLLIENQAQSIPYNYNYFLIVKDAELLEKADKDGFLNMGIKLNTSFRLLDSKVLLNDFSDVVKLDSVLISNFPMPCFFRLEKFSLILVNFLREHSSAVIKDVVNSFLSDFSSEQDKNQAEVLLLENIKNFILKGIIRIKHV